ncbi:MAG: choice-of-anchor J domain-containing protein, partial [Prevotella sp.]|nr:choice-of-anchor J domain-containing protein [Prevotella sp.]
MKKFHRFRAALIGIMVLLGGLQAHAQQRVSASYVPTIYGIVLNSSAWLSGDPQFGVYSFMPGQPVIVTTLEHQDRWLRANSGGVWYGGKLHYMNSLQGSGDNALNLYQRWDTDSWTMEIDHIMEADESAKLAADLTYDPTTEQVYGIFFTADGSAYEFGTMEFTDASPVKHSLKRTPIDMVAIAASPQGEVFGIGVNGFLYKFDKSTGNATIVGNTDVAVSAYRQSATFDFRSGKLYWAAMVSEESSALYEVNTTTGKATRLGKFANGEEVVALYIPFGLADDHAPSQAENMSVDFPEGSLTGHFNFTVPTENYATETLTGEVDYTILVDGQQVGTGKSEAGAAVSEQLTLTEGNHVFTVVLKNAYGEGPKSKLTAYIGFDKPVAPGNVQLSINNDTYEAKLTWDTPERGVNNGYIDKENMRYIIKRYPGPVTLESDYEGNVYFDELPEQTGLRSYRYTVVGWYADKTGEEATTPTVNVGQAQEIPWREDFSDSQTFSQFTVIDVNGDGWTWVYNRSSHAADCQNNDIYNSFDDDDWLITPPLHLLGDRTYDLEFEASSNWAWDRAGQELLEVGFGDNALAQNYEMIIENRTIQQTEEKIPVKVTAKLRPAKDGTYFVGFHAVTPLANAFHLYIHNIQVVESSLLTSPDSVTNLQL